jgi:hypothetical protein
MEKRREWDREAVGEVFLASDPLYHWVFGIGDGKEEPLKFHRRQPPRGNGAADARIQASALHRPA